MKTYIVHLRHQDRGLIVSTVMAISPALAWICALEADLYGDRATLNGLRTIGDLYRLGYHAGTISCISEGAHGCKAN